MSHGQAPPHGPARDIEILIIGSGFAGLAMAIALRNAGIEDFVILERADDLGGTWRDNHYPGCACDVQSHLYSFSFEPNPEWSHAFAPQPEIQRYLQHCARKYGVWPHIELRQHMVRAEYDDACARWHVRTASGSHFRARVVVSGVGFLANPAYPNVPGIERFEGERFHSARWNHDYDLRGKRVAVIGTGASAIQFVPEIAPQVTRLDVFQRTPPWILPKPDRPITELEKRLFRRVPWLQRLRRGLLYAALEARVLGLVFRPEIMRAPERAALKHIERQIADPELRRKVTPDYKIGCKRILLSNNYYPALNRSNVHLITEGIREIRARSVVTQRGEERHVDALIYGTGFRTSSPLPRGVVFGREGRPLDEAWNEGAQAYKGTTVSGFPNLFFILGPNTGLGHSSMVYMIESQVAYILDAVLRMRAEGWASVDVDPSAQQHFNQRLEAKHRNTVWYTGCHSWYLNESGKNTTLWPDFTFRFRRQVARFDPQSYRIERRPGDARTPRSEAPRHSSHIRRTPQPSQPLDALGMESSP